MRVLILSCNTGGGHNSAAKAIQEVLNTRNDQAQMKDTLAFTSKAFSNIICDTYVGLVKHTPKLFGLLYNSNKKITYDKKVHSVSYQGNVVGSKKIAEYIKDEKIDAVICTHFMAAQALNHLVKHKKVSVPFFFVATDYSITPMLEEAPLVSKIFCPHFDSVYTYLNKGIPEDKLICTGIPVSKVFLEPKDREGARKKFGIGADEKAILVMTGSMGFGDSQIIVQQLLKRSDEKTRVVLICGNNKKLYEKVQKTLGNDKRLILVGFTNEVSAYMDACDIILTKPGGLSSTEALVKGIPIVHTSPIPGCETENADFFMGHHFSLCAHTTMEVVEESLRLLRDDFLRKQIIEAQKHFRLDYSAQKIVYCVHEYLVDNGYITKE